MYLYESKHKSGITVKVVACTESESRIITFEICYHRYIQSQFLKHRMFSVNSASSRAISVPKMNSLIRSNPAIPSYWGANKKGMQPEQEVPNKETVEQIWRHFSQVAMMQAEGLNEDSDLHQQIANRITEPYQMISQVITATDLDNFFKLRISSDAQSEINILAQCMKDCWDNTVVERVSHNSWHLPYVTPEELSNNSLEDNKILSAARCAVVSYHNHEGGTLTLEQAKKIYRFLTEGECVHYTPLEHQARSETLNEKMLRLITYDFAKKHLPVKKLKSLEYYANFNKWLSSRYLLESSNEAKK